jgi:hypothetical protein
MIFQSKTSESTKVAIPDGDDNNDNNDFNDNDYAYDNN